MTHRRPLWIVLLLTVVGGLCAAVLWLLIDSRYHIEAQRFSQESSTILAEAFFQIVLDRKTLQAMADTHLRQKSDRTRLADRGQIWHDLQTALACYSKTEIRLRELLAKNRLTLPWHYAITVGPYTLQEPQRKPVYPILDATGNEEMPLFGDLRKIDHGMQKFSFFYHGLNYSLQINFYCHFPALRGFLWVRLRPWLLLVLLTVLVIVAASAFISRTIRNERRLARMQGDILNTLTHEVNTPLTAIAVAIENLRLLGGRPGDGRPTELLAVITRQKRRLQEMLGKAIQVARLDQPGWHPDCSPQDLHRLLEELLADFRLTRPAMTIESRLAACLTLVDADPGLLAMAVGNLFDNAVKYGGNPPQIVLESGNSPGQVWLDISDNGPGIPSKDRPQIFKRFYQGRRSGNDHKGLGIGLYLARRIAMAHHGSLALYATAASGSTFRLTLPLAREKA